MTDDRKYSTRTLQRLKLREAGFDPIPLADKGPRLKEWPKYVGATEDVIKEWDGKIRTWPGTGLISKRTPGVDIDITIEAAATDCLALIREHFADKGKVIRRIGRAPKALVPFRTDNPYPKKALKFRAPDGSGQLIEVLANGQQFAAFARHPGTGLDYQWPDGALGRVKREELPELNETEALSLLAQLSKMLQEKHGFLIDTRPETKPKENNSASFATTSEEKVGSALNALHNNLVYDDWLNILFAIRSENTGWFHLFDSWSQTSAKYDARTTRHKWDTAGGRSGVTIATLFWMAQQHGWTWAEEHKVGETGAWVKGVTLDDFYALMTDHLYIFVPTRATWPSASVDARLGRIKVGVNDDSEDVTLNASLWLDKNQPVEQVTWAPGLNLIIRNRLPDMGGWIERQDVSCFNLYRPPNIIRGLGGEAKRWVDLAHRVYPGEADHLIKWFAHRVQRPGEKINHGIIMGGKPGVGKDTIIEGLKQAVGPWNFAEISPKQVLDKNNAFLKSVVIRVSEVKDLGQELNRFEYYESTKTMKAAPPDSLQVHEKYLRPYWIMNCCGIIETSNNKDSFYLPDDDRRNYVAWSQLLSNEFDKGFWNEFYEWYEKKDGYRHVAAYLAELDLRALDAKAPPPKTVAFWEIVETNRPPEETDLANAIVALKSPNALTLEDLQTVAMGHSFTSLYQHLTDVKTRRAIPRRLREVGYESIRYASAEHGQWTIDGKRQVIYVKVELNIKERYAAAEALKNKKEKMTADARDPAARAAAEAAVISLFGRQKE